MHLGTSPDSCQDAPDVNGSFRLGAEDSELSRRCGVLLYVSIAEGDLP